MYAPDNENLVIRGLFVCKGGIVMYIVWRGKNKDGEGYYEIRVVLGNDAKKKQKRWTKIIHARTMQGARKIAAKMKREGKIPDDYSGTAASFVPVTFQDCVAQWKEEHYAFLAPRTQVNYDSMLDNYILDFFACRPLRKMSVDDIRRFIRYLHTSGGHATRSGKLSATMINKCYRLLSEILTDAEKNKFISHNPCLELAEKEIPQAAYQSTPIWQPSELKAFLLHLEGLPDSYPNFQKKVMFHIIMMTGMRKGEISVLQWSDVNVQKNSLQVNKALKQMTSTDLIIDTPKTKRSNREIFIDSYTLQLLNELYNRQKNYLLEIGRENPDEYIFITQRRKTREIIPVTPSYLYIWLRQEARKCGLPPIKVHSIRHMAATYALANGAPILGVQNMMGHTSLRTTSIYLHLTENQKQDTAKVLSSEMAALRGDKDD